MKKSLPSLISSLLLVLFFILQVSQLGAQVVLNNNPADFIVTENSFSGITIHNTFSQFNSFEVVTDEGTFTEIGAEKYAYTEERGLPKLPVIRKLISIPAGAELDVKIISAKVKEYSLESLGITNKLFPTQPPVAKNNTGKLPFVIDRKAYTTDHFFGGEIASAEILGFMRNNRVARVDISPVQYNPVTGMLRVYEDVVVKVSFNGGDWKATRDLTEKTNSPYFHKLGTMFANQLPVLDSREYITQYPVKMVIVSDPMFQETLQPFIQWKIKKGFTVVEAYTNNPAVGNTTSSIKNYLQNLYEAGTPEDPSPSFILFVGDVAQIPAFSQGGHVTDLYYCEYTNDYMPEMYYGRFSATSIDQLQPQIDKTLMYEQYQFPDPSFLGECVMIAGMDPTFGPTHGNGQINYGTTYYFNAAHGFLSHTYLYPESGSSDPLIIQNVSDGVGFANYTAHGSSSGWADPTFSISDIPGLQNDGKYPLMIGNCCLTSTYNTSCFGEELLRASHKGAVGYIGGSNSTYWDEDFYFGVGVGQVTPNPTYEGTTLGSYDRSFHDHGEPFEDWYTTMDQIIFAGNMAVMEGSPSSTEYYWEIYCLMGDPSLMAYMAVPPAMTVTYDGLMPLSAADFTVNACPYAYVAISKDGVLYGAALADENGVAVVSLNPITVPGNADIVVTAQNKQPVIGTVVVASPDGPYVLMQTQAVNDEAGNNNLQVDYNETFGFNMTLKNVGNTDAQNVTSVLSTTSPYVTIKNATENWGSIPSQSTVNKTLAFEIGALDYLPDQVTAPFTLTVTNGSDTWVSTFNIKLNAPVLNANSVLIDDSQTLNPNGRLDAGETVIIQVPVSNTGHSGTSDAMTYLFSDSQSVNITESGYFTGNIASGSTATAFYEVSVADTTPVGTLLNFFVSSNAAPYYVARNYVLPAGLIIEDFETGDFSAYNWQNTSAQPWTINPLVFNSGSYAARSGLIADNASTSLSIDMDVSTNDNITFARKVSSESGYDFLKFYIDDTEKGSWSGEADWSNVTYAVTPGTHTFKWTYSKDVNTTGGSDAAYIDDIIFPSGSAGGPGSEFAVHPFSYPPTACEGKDLNLFAFVTNNPANVVYEWAPAELISNDSIYNPVANLIEPTNFTVTAYSGFSSAQKSILVNISPLPEAPQISLQGEVLISSIAEGNQWYNSNGLIEGANGQSFEPIVSDNYYATIRIPGGCESVASNEIYVEVVSVPVITTGSQFNVYPNPFSNILNVEFSLSNSTSVKISLVNLVGQEINELYNNVSSNAGNYNLQFHPSNLKPGVYFIKLSANDSEVLRKVVLIK